MTQPFGERHFLGMDGDRRRLADTSGVERVLIDNDIDTVKMSEVADDLAEWSVYELDSCFGGQLLPDLGQLPRVGCRSFRGTGRIDVDRLPLAVRSGEDM